MSVKRLALILFLLLWASASAAEIKPFLADSLQQIKQARQGQPFMLVLWSLDCPPCMRELDTLNNSAKAIPAGRLVLVSTDTQASESELTDLLQKFKLAGRDNWVFADSYSERLRFSIDPQWSGELPRAYLYKSDHRRSANSGLLSETQLQQWLQTVGADDKRVPGYDHE